MNWKEEDIKTKVELCRDVHFIRGKEELEQTQRKHKGPQDMAKFCNDKIKNFDTLGDITMSICVYL